MNKVGKWIDYLLIGLQILMLFIWVNEGFLEIPDALQPIGRLHPLMLHLPIGFFVILVLLYYLRNEVPPETFRKLFTFLAASVAFAATLAAIFGLFLSREEGYSPESLNWHKWGGIAFALVAYAIYLSTTYSSFKFNKGLVPIGLLALIATGHFGGEITHGEGYLTAGWEENKAFVFDPNGTVSDAAIYPILQKKCLTCHNNRKMKGELNMASMETLLLGGKNGKVWEVGDAFNSTIVQRSLLELSDKKHMPPKGKLQLSLAEIDLLSLWIDRGADTLKFINELASDDSLNLLIESIYLKHITANIYTFKAASEKVLESVNTPFCSVEPIAIGSPALKANFYVIERFNEATLNNLASVSEQLVSLNLNKMPVGDKQLEFIASFKNLEKLNLNLSEITGQNIDVLAACESLESLSLSGCKLVSESFENISKIKSLKKLFLWNTNLDEKELAKFIADNSSIEVIIGNNEIENEYIKLNAPVASNKNSILKEGEKVELKHGIQNVAIRYTTDGSIPDSANGLIYKTGLPVNGLMKINAIATKKGWYASDLKSYSFFKSSFKADSAWLITPTNEEYPGKGFKTVIDVEQGNINNFKNLSWLGYKSRAEIMLKVDVSKQIKGLSVSYLSNLGSYIMPPTSIELWGGNNINDMKLLGTKNPKQPTAQESNTIKGEVFELKETYLFFKVIAKPLIRLPNWHPAKGERAWLFIDEIYLY